MHPSTDALVPPLTDSPSWRDDALCAQVDTETFFPDKGGSTADAKAICARCDVRAECLEYALSFERGHTELIHGVWGGLSTTQRRRAIRAEERAAQRSAGAA